MKRLLALSLALILAMLPLRAEEPRAKLLLVSFDGLRPEIYRDERYSMPNLRGLAARGVQARKVVGVFPTLTYPSHTSIVTGVRPARHGIVANTIFDPLDGGKRWFWESEHITATTLWDAAHKAGLVTAGVRWPVTVGAAIDWNLPEAFAPQLLGDHWGAFKKACTPGLFEELGLTKPKNVVDEPELDALATKGAAGIIESKKPDLLLLHLVQADGAQHEHGRDADETKRAFEKLDEHLGTLLRALEAARIASATNVIVTGDHGFLDTHTSVRPNAILREAGLVKLDDKKKIVEWQALAQSCGGSAPVYLRDPSDSATAALVVKRLKEAATRYRGIFQVLDRDALDREEAFPGAVCALEFEPGFTAEWTPEGPVLAKAGVRGNHGYLPTREELATGFVAAGPGFVRGVTVPQLRQIDIAPTAARVLKIDLGPGVEGFAIPGILQSQE